MKLSIIVPVYNAQARLRVCLDSILQQTFPGFELILVNDGSTDDSLAVCREYAQKDARVVVLDKENGGAGEARNTGLDTARGRYILFIDADDTVLPEMAEGLLALMTAETDVVCCAHREQTEGQSEILTKGYRMSEDPWRTTDVAACVLAMEQANQFCYLWNKLFRRDVIEENRIRFQKRFITGQDLDFVIQYFYHVQNCVLTNDAPYLYYSNGINSLCSRYKPGLYEIVSELSEERMQAFQHFGLLDRPEGAAAYQQSHITYLHSCVPNLFRKRNGLRRKQKLQQLQQVLSDEKLQAYMPASQPEGRIGRIFKKVVLKQSSTYAYRVYSVLFAVRNGSDKLYRRLRGRQTKQSA